MVFFAICAFIRILGHNQIFSKVLKIDDIVYSIQIPRLKICMIKCEKINNILFFV